MIFPYGYLLKSFPQWDTSARQRGFEIRAFPLPRASTVDRASTARLPVIPLTTRSQQVVFTYDQVIRPHRNYRASGGLPRGDPRSRHRWICLQLSFANGADNGGVRDCSSLYTINLIEAVMALPCPLRSSCRVPTLAVTFSSCYWPGCYLCS